MKTGLALARHPNWTPFDGLLVDGLRCVHAAVQFTGDPDVFADRHNSLRTRVFRRRAPALDDPANHGIFLHYLLESGPVELRAGPAGCTLRCAAGDDAGLDLGELLARGVLGSWGQR